MKARRAPLLANIPAERFRSMDGTIPQIGDVVVLDQGFTFPDGTPGCLVQCRDANGNIRWEAEVYESELGRDIGT